MHTGELAERRRLEMDIERLGLADVGTTIGSEVKDLLLGDLPDGLVDGFDVIGDAGNILDGAVVRDNHVLHLVIPQTEIDELAQEPWADDLEFSSENTAGVDVTINRCVNNYKTMTHERGSLPGIWLKAFIEA